jgi:uncharacterized MAPEG superfamily protein
VLAGNLARLDNGSLNALSLGYLVVRFVYNWVYVNGESQALGEFIPCCLGRYPGPLVDLVALIMGIKADDLYLAARSRTLIWGTGVGLCMTLFIKAGNALRLA